MLGRGVDRDVLVLAGHRHRDLAFQVEMVLPAEAHPPFDALWRFLDRCLCVAALERQRRRDELALLRVEIGNVEDERQLFILDLREPRGATRLLARPGDDAINWLAEKLHDAVGEHRLVMAAGRRDVVLARNILRRQHVDDARRGAHRRQVHLPDPAMRDCRQSETAMQQAGRFRHVVDIDGSAGDVLMRGIVALVGGDAARDLLGLEVGRMRRHRPVPLAGDMSGLCGIGKNLKYGSASSSTRLKEGRCISLVR